MYIPKILITRLVHLVGTSLITGSGMANGKAENNDRNTDISLLELLEGNVTK